jgi:tetratricopeptide (TPR) repeat protein
MVSLNNISLTASMIVRNEERFLEGCLESIKNVVDEIVIVDTGSTDGSKEIAAQYGARVIDFPWKGDFSAARNRSLDESLGEWILYIDADERLRSVSRQEVMRVLSDKSNAAYTLKFHPISGYTPYREYRIFRNNPRIRFQGVIHETIFPAIDTVLEEDGLGIGTSSLEIDHEGYDGDLLHKHRRNLPMLLRQIERDPKRMYLRWQLGIAQKGLGDVEGAERTWMEAIEMSRAKETVTHEDSSAYYEMIYLINERGGDATELLDESLSLFPDNYLLLWTRAMTLMHGSRFEEAVPIFKFLTSIDPDSLDGPLSYNSAIFRELSYEPLATCLFKLGEYDGSLKYYSLALERCPDNAEYQTKWRYLSVLAGKY